MSRLVYVKYVYVYLKLYSVYDIHIYTYIYIYVYSKGLSENRVTLNPKVHHHFHQLNWQFRGLP